MREELPQRRGEELLVPCIQGLDIHQVAADFKQSTAGERGPRSGREVVRADVLEGQEQEEAVDDLFSVAASSRCQYSALKSFASGERRRSQRHAPMPSIRARK